LLPKSDGFVTSRENTSTVTRVPMEDACELRDELFRGCAPSSNALEVGQQVRGGPGRAGGDVRHHQVPH